MFDLYRQYLHKISLIIAASLVDKRRIFQVPIARVLKNHKLCLSGFLRAREMASNVITEWDTGA
jgi:hypothetical protein